MSKNMTRHQSMQLATIDNGTAITGAIDITEFSSGVVITPAAWTDANIGIKVSQASDGTYVVLHDVSASPVQIAGITTDASLAYTLPDEIFACGHIKLWSKNTTVATITDNNQGAARSLWVILKS